MVALTEDAFAETTMSVKPARLEVLAEGERARDELLGERPVAVAVLGGEAAGVHADADGDARLPCRVDHGVHARQRRRCCRG